MLFNDFDSFSSSNENDKINILLGLKEISNEKLKLFLPIIGLAILLSGCSKWIDRGESITAVGSSALQPLVEQLLKLTRQKILENSSMYKGAEAELVLSQVQSGAVDIGNSDLFAEEKSGDRCLSISRSSSSSCWDHSYCEQGYWRKDISMEKPEKLFTGEIKNWSEVGGKDQPVVILNRASGKRNP